jgi:hypothetical protein
MMRSDSPQGVSPHYLDRVVATAQAHEVQASEDIIAGNGIKLLAKGARIDAGVRDRLLQHKLRRPLEECVLVTPGVIPSPVELASAPRLEEAVPRIARLAGTLQRFRESRAWIDGRIAQAKPALRAVLEIGLQRILRIQASFSSTGLDAHSSELLLAELAALGDPRVYTEIMMLIGELEWRMRELEREQRLRADQLQVSDRAVIVELIDRIKGTAGI